LDLLLYYQHHHYHLHLLGLLDLLLQYFLEGLLGL
jgi:hypothetical protein